MSYIINNSRGQIVAVIPDGVVNTSATNLALIGQAVTNYGTYQNENYLYLLENFANNTAPTTPILGQLWYNANTDVLNAYNSANTWTELASKSYVDTLLTASFISPSFSGTPTAPTATAGTNTTQIATTAFVNQSIGNFSGNINNATLVGANISNATISNTSISNSTLSNVSLTGNSTAVTATYGTSTTQIATTEFVINQVSNTTGNITTGSIAVTNSISAVGNITGGNVIAISNVSAGNISTTGSIQSLGNVTAPYFVGNVSGNISGNITIGGSNTQVVFNDNGIANATAGFTFNKVTNAVRMTGTLTVDTVVANSVVTTGTTSAFRLPNLTQTQINALSPQNGDMVYNTTTDLPQIYQGGSWKNFTISYYS